jgi:ABC-type transport system substrate-binding protein
MAGFRDASLYPNKVSAASVATAKKLAAGHTQDGKVVLYAGNRGATPLRAQILQFNLKQIGLDVETKLFARAVQIEKESTRGEPFDLTLEGWIADYADPYDFIDVLLNGKNLQPAHNNNVAYFNDPKYNAKMNAAARLAGSQRYAAYGALDVDMFKNSPPWASYQNFNSRVFVSKRVGCFVYNAIYTVDLAASCIK